jgi:hypothetical protein
MAFRLQPAHSSPYIMWQLNCRHVYAQAAADLIGAAAPHVNVERIKNLWLTLPPRPEQDEIAAVVERECAGPKSAIARAEREISFLREYRTRLIADVVTGRLDVREAAARLSHETEEKVLEDGSAVLGEEETPEVEEGEASLEETNA